MNGGGLLRPCVGFASNRIHRKGVKDAKVKAEASLRGGRKPTKQSRCSPHGRKAGTDGNSVCGNVMRTYRLSAPHGEWVDRHAHRGSLAMTNPVVFQMLRSSFFTVAIV